MVKNIMRRIFVGDFKMGVEEKRAVNEVLEGGRISEWKKTKEFEKLFADYVGTKYCIALSSGTSALIAGLMALINDERFPRVRKGSKVITSPLTYISDANSIVLAGLQPVFVDVDPINFLITPENIEKHLANVEDIENYSIILPVHLIGYPCDMEGINRIAKKYGLTVFEDAAQAHGTIYKGKKAGSLGLLSIFSFYIAHNIQAGEMGAITTDDRDLLKLILKIKTNGRMCDCPICTRSSGICPKINNYKGEDDFDPRFVHDLIGYNFKIMEFQAALGVSQLKNADLIFKKRQENVKFLNEQLDKYKDIFQLPVFSKNVSYLVYPIVIKNSAKISRKILRQELEKNGIETRPIFGSIPTQQPAYSYLKDDYKDKLPNADYIGKNGFYIGCHQYLDKEDLKYIIKTFERVIKKIC